MKNIFSTYKVGSRKQLHLFLTLPYPLRLGPISSGVLTTFLSFLIIVSVHAARLIYLVFTDSITLILFMNITLYIMKYLIIQFLRRPAVYRLLGTAPPY